MPDEVYREVIQLVLDTADSRRALQEFVNDVNNMRESLRAFGDPFAAVTAGAETASQRISSLGEIGPVLDTTSQQILTIIENVDALANRFPVVSRRVNTMAGNVESASERSVASIREITEALNGLTSASMEASGYVNAVIASIGGEAQSARMSVNNLAAAFGSLPASSEEGAAQTIRHLSAISEKAIEETLHVERLGEALRSLPAVPDYPSSTTRRPQYTEEEYEEPARLPPPTRSERRLTEYVEEDYIPLPAMPPEEIARGMGYNVRGGQVYGSGELGPIVGSRRLSDLIEQYERRISGTSHAFAESGYAPSLSAQQSHPALGEGFLRSLPGGHILMEEELGVLSRAPVPQSVLGTYGASGRFGGFIRSQEEPPGIVEDWARAAAGGGPVGGPYVDFSRGELALASPAIPEMYEIYGGMEAALGHELGHVLHQQASLNPTVAARAGLVPSALRSEYDLEMWSGPESEVMKYEDVSPAMTAYRYGLMQMGYKSWQIPDEYMAETLASIMYPETAGSSRRYYQTVGSRFQSEATSLANQFLGRAPLTPEVYSGHVGWEVASQDMPQVVERLERMGREPYISLSDAGAGAYKFREAGLFSDVESYMTPDESEQFDALVQERRSAFLAERRMLSAPTEQAWRPGGLPSKFEASSMLGAPTQSSQFPPYVKNFLSYIERFKRTNEYSRYHEWLTRIGGASEESFSQISGYGREEEIFGNIPQHILEFVSTITHGGRVPSWQPSTRAISYPTAMLGRYGIAPWIGHEYGHATAQYYNVGFLPEYASEPGAIGMGNAFDAYKQLMSASLGADAHKAPDNLLDQLSRWRSYFINLGEAYHKEDMPAESIADVFGDIYAGDKSASRGLPVNLAGYRNMRRMLTQIIQSPLPGREQDLGMVNELHSSLGHRPEPRLFEPRSPLGMLTGPELTSLEGITDIIPPELGQFLSGVSLSSEIPAGAGRYSPETRGIELSSQMTPEEARKILGHELGEASIDVLERNIVARRYIPTATARTMMHNVFGSHLDPFSERGRTGEVYEPSILGGPIGEYYRGMAGAYGDDPTAIAREMLANILGRQMTGYQPEENELLDEYIEFMRMRSGGVGVDYESVAEDVLSMARSSGRMRQPDPVLVRRGDVPSELPGGAYHNPDVPLRCASITQRSRTGYEEGTYAFDDYKGLYELAPLTHDVVRPENMFLKDVYSYINQRGERVPDFYAAMGSGFDPPFIPASTDFRSFLVESALSSQMGFATHLQMNEVFADFNRVERATPVGAPRDIDYTEIIGRLHMEGAMPPNVIYSMLGSRYPSWLGDSAPYGTDVGRLFSGAMHTSRTSGENPIDFLRMIPEQRYNAGRQAGWEYGLEDYENEASILAAFNGLSGMNMPSLSMVDTSSKLSEHMLDRLQDRSKQAASRYADALGIDYDELTDEELASAFTDYADTTSSYRWYRPRTRRYKEYSVPPPGGVPPEPPAPPDDIIEGEFREVQSPLMLADSRRRGMLRYLQDEIPPERYPHGAGMLRYLEEDIPPDRGGVWRPLWKEEPVRSYRESGFLQEEVDRIYGSANASVYGLRARFREPVDEVERMNRVVREAERRAGIFPDADAMIFEPTGSEEAAKGAAGRLWEKLTGGRGGEGGGGGKTPTGEDAGDGGAEEATKGMDMFGQAMLRTAGYFMRWLIVWQVFNTVRDAIRNLIEESMRLEEVSARVSFISDITMPEAQTYILGQYAAAATYGISTAQTAQAVPGAAAYGVSMEYAAPLSAMFGIAAPTAVEQLQQAKYMTGMEQNQLLNLAATMYQYAPTRGSEMMDVVAQSGLMSQMIGLPTEQIAEALTMTGRTMGVSPLQATTAMQRLSMRVPMEMMPGFLEEASDMDRERLTQRLLAMGVATERGGRQTQIMTELIYQLANASDDGSKAMRSWTELVDDLASTTGYQLGRVKSEWALLWAELGNISGVSRGVSGTVKSVADVLEDFGVIGREAGRTRSGGESGSPLVRGIVGGIDALAGVARHTDTMPGSPFATWDMIGGSWTLWSVIIDSIAQGIQNSNYDPWPAIGDAIKEYLKTGMENTPVIGNIYDFYRTYISPLTSSEAQYQRTSPDQYVDMSGLRAAEAATALRKPGDATASGSGYLPGLEDMFLYPARYMLEGNKRLEISEPQFTDLLPRALETFSNNFDYSIRMLQELADQGLIDQETVDSFIKEMDSGIEDMGGIFRVEGADTYLRGKEYIGMQMLMQEQPELFRAPQFQYEPEVTSTRFMRANQMAEAEFSRLFAGREDLRKQLMPEEHVFVGVKDGLLELVISQEELNRTMQLLNNNLTGMWNVPAGSEIMIPLPQDYSLVSPGSLSGGKSTQTGQQSTARVWEPGVGWTTPTASGGESLSQYGTMATIGAAIYALSGTSGKFTPATSAGSLGSAFSQLSQPQAQPITLNATVNVTIDGRQVAAAVESILLNGVRTYARSYTIADDIHAGGP